MRHSILVFLGLCLLLGTAYADPPTPDRAIQNIMEELHRPTILIVVEPNPANSTTPAPVREPKTVPLPEPDEPEDGGSVVPS